MKVGILGAGQLGRMLALAGYPLGLEFEFLDPTPGSPAGQLAPQRVAAYTDQSALAKLAECDVVTFEFENVPDAAAELLSQKTLVFPPPAALSIAQDRLLEKRCFRELGLETPEFEAVDDTAGLKRAVERLGLPCVLKTRRFGYDGKGQRLLREPADLEPAMASLAGKPLILEQFVAFARELSLVAVRDRNGLVKSYPLIQNEHHHGILHRSTAPATVDSQLAHAAERNVERLLNHLDYVGVLTVEFFDVAGRLLANEFAPRVHNSGHWTIEAATTSQFENHLRAVLGLPLGETDLLCHAAMFNLVGQLPDKNDVLRIAGAHYHDYGKQLRPGRKLGHVTLTAPTAEGLMEPAAQLEALLDV